MPELQILECCYNRLNSNFYKQFLQNLGKQVSTIINLTSDLDLFHQATVIQLESKKKVYTCIMS